MFQAAFTGISQCEVMCKMKLAYCVFASRAEVESCHATEVSNARHTLETFLDFELVFHYYTFKNYFFKKCVCVCMNACHVLRCTHMHTEIRRGHKIS